MNLHEASGWWLVVGLDATLLPLSPVPQFSRQHLDAGVIERLHRLDPGVELARLRLVCLAAADQVAVHQKEIRLLRDDRGAEHLERRRCNTA